MGIYMKFGDIRGDATQDGFQRWINVTNFEWGPAVQRNIRTRTGRARNREPSQPHIGNMTIVKEVDHASGPLYKSLCTTPKAQDCKIAFVRTGEGGETYLQYTLTDTLLAGVALSGEGDRATEAWTLDFTEVEIEVKRLDEANVSQASYFFKYNLATGKRG